MDIEAGSQVNMALQQGFRACCGVLSGLPQALLPYRMLWGVAACQSESGVVCPSVQVAAAARARGYPFPRHQFPKTSVPTAGGKTSKGFSPISHL